MGAVATGQVVRRIEKVFGIFGALALVITYFTVTGRNPLPGLVDRIAAVGDLSRPAPAWTHRYPDEPTASIALAGAVIVVMPEAVEALSPGRGVVLWHRDAEWAAVAGENANSTVVVGLRGRGIEAVEPQTGRTRWKAAEVLGVWTFATALLALTCPASGDCVLSSLSLSDGTVRWRLAVPGIGREADGANRGLLGVRNTGHAYGAATGAVPATVPQTLGLAVQRRAELLDPATGTRFSPVTPQSAARVTVTGGRVVVTTARSSGGRCETAIEAREPATGAVAWRRSGLDPHTVAGAGCEQRRAPTGGGAVLAVTRDDGRHLLLSAVDGRDIWVGDPGESVRALGESYALVQSADGTAIRAVDTVTGAVRWSAPLAKHAPGRDLSLCRAGR